MLKKEIGLRIKSIRINMCLSKQKLASMLGISGQYLGMIERGEGSLSVEKLQILCNLTHLSADYILFGKDSSIPAKVINLLSEYTDEQIEAGFNTLHDFATFIRHIEPVTSNESCKIAEAEEVSETIA